MHPLGAAHPDLPNWGVHVHRTPPHTPCQGILTHLASGKGWLGGVSGVPGGAGGVPQKGQLGRGNIKEDGAAPKTPSLCQGRRSAGAGGRLGAGTGHGRVFQTFQGFVGP